MEFDPNAVETILVDSYSTLVNEVSTREALAQYTDHPEALARIWYERSSIYGIAVTMLGEYRTTEKRHAEALDYALHSMDIDISEAEREQILETAEYEPFDDVRGALERLNEGGYDIYVLSNGDPDMLAHMVQTAEIDDLVADTISAADVGIYKPDPRLYRYTAQKVDTPVSELVHVTASWYDIQGASYTGMQTAWVRRLGKTWEAVLKDPHLKIDSLYEIADELGV